MTGACREGGKDNADDMPASENAPPARDHAKISLVIATRGRREELDRCLASLRAQTLRPHEIVIVDQNPSGWLDMVVASHTEALPLRHLTRPPRGASFARNQGLAAATGDWVGFPDDDCWATPDWLRLVADVLAGPDAPDALCVPLHDEKDLPLVLRWPRRATPITRRNVWQSCLMAGFFARRALLSDCGGLAENIGVGSVDGLGSGEETDLALRLIASGARVEFRPVAGLRHPARPPFGDLAGRAESYGRGFGYVWTRHALSTAGFYYYCLRAALGGLRARLSGDQGGARYYGASLHGRLAGRRLALKERA